MRQAHLKPWLHGIGSAIWLGGAIEVVRWIVARWAAGYSALLLPLVCFGLWVAVLSVAVLIARDADHSRREFLRNLGKALRYGAVSVPALVVGVILFEFWTVTVTVAFLFAVCRYFTAERVAALG